MAPGANNIHGTALVLSDRGILVIGASGSGKTTLALALLQAFNGPGRFGRLVGDDQLFVEGRNGRLLCRAPRTIAGLVEVPGIGPRPLPVEPAAVIDLIVRLVPAADFQRLQEEAQETIVGCAVPRLDCAERNMAAALAAVAAVLGCSPFG